MATTVNPDVCTLSDSNCKDSKANVSGYLGLWERTTNVSGITTGTRTHPLMYKWLALENISEGSNFNMLANVPEAEAPKVHCPMRTRGHLEKTCSSQSKGILLRSLETDMKRRANLWWSMSTWWALSSPWGCSLAILWGVVSMRLWFRKNYPLWVVPFSGLGSWVIHKGESELCTSTLRSQLPDEGGNVTSSLRSLPS